MARPTEALPVHVGGLPADPERAAAADRRTDGLIPSGWSPPALAVASLVAVGEAFWIIRARSVTGHGDPTGSGTSNPPVAAAPVTTAPRSSAASANPALDPCLVGKWRMISMQITADDWEGVAESTFSGAVGMTVRIWPDGKEVDDYNASTSLTATIKGAKYVLWYRGVQTKHVQTRGGRIFVSEISGAQKYRMVRNGKTVQSGPANQQAPPDLPYICTETRLTVYGSKEDYSTDAFTRVSHTP